MELSKENINKLISSDFSTIEKDGDLSLLLLFAYSKLFLGGKQPSSCSRCMRNMHVKIIKNGLKILEAMAKKTCVMVPGNVHVHKLGKHFSDAGITDEVAIELLEAGHLQERHFKALPKAYKQKPEAVEVEEVELEEENKGKFTNDNLVKLNGNKLIGFAEKVTGKNQKNKKEAIEALLNWQKSE